jgi:hypothetical protein
VRERANAGECETDESRGDSETEVRIEREMFGRVHSSVVWCVLYVCVCAIEFIKNFRSSPAISSLVLLVQATRWHVLHHLR